MAPERARSGAEARAARAARLRRAGPLLLAAACFVLLALLLRGRVRELAALTVASPAALAAAPAVAALLLALRGESMARLLAVHGPSLGRAERFHLAVANRLGNYLTPSRGGAVARALYLRRRFGLPYAEFVAQMAASAALTLLVASAAGALAAAALWAGGSAPSRTIAALLGAVAAGLAAGLAAAPRVLAAAGPRLPERLRAVALGWLRLRRDRRRLGALLGLAALERLATALLFLLVCRGLGAPITGAESLLVTAVASVGMLLSVTPAGLGLYELVVVATGSAVGLGAVESLQGALALRGVNGGLLALLGPLSVRSLAKRLGAGAEPADAPSAEAPRSEGSAARVGATEAPCDAAST